MNKTLKGALAVLVFGAICLVAYSGISRWLFQKKQIEETIGASDAKVNTIIRGCGDDYAGYFFIDSPVMKLEAARRGLGVTFNNKPNGYAERLEKFNKGEYDFIVMPIGQYLQHGAKYHYPGVIVSSIADSFGADAILAFSDKLPTGTVKDLNDASLKIVYTGESPSSFLMDLAIVDFELARLTKTDSWRVEVNSSEEALEKAKLREGDAFIMWEPQVSRALKEIPGLKVVFGSDRFSGYITDVIIFRRDYLRQHEDDAIGMMEAYFSTMRTYKADRNKLVADMRTTTGLNTQGVEDTLKKIKFHDLQTNCMRQFGLKIGVEGEVKYGVLNSIVACSNVLTKTGKLNAALEDPYRIINSAVLRRVYSNLPADIGNGAGKREFVQINEDEWKQLSPIGRLRVEPISFNQGSSELDENGLAAVDAIYELLANNYPDTRVVIAGHTGKSEDEQANVQLSCDRAKAVKERLVEKGLSPNRFKSAGHGSAIKPVDSATGQTITSPRMLQSKASRVEFDLFLDVSSF